jgi:hypothetical protein
MLRACESHISNMLFAGYYDHVNMPRNLAMQDADVAACRAPPNAGSTFYLRRYEIHFHFPFLEVKISIELTHANSNA